MKRALDDGRADMKGAHPRGGWGGGYIRLASNDRQGMTVNECLLRTFQKPIESGGGGHPLPLLWRKINVFSVQTHNPYSSTSLAGPVHVNIVKPPPPPASAETY